MTDTRAIYLLGGPGVGKSTTLAAIFTALGLTPVTPAERQVPGVFLNRLVDKEGWTEGWALGRLRYKYSGTDALHRAVMADILPWIREVELPSWILGEGARLGNSKFLVPLSYLVDDLLVVHLTAPEELAESRRADFASPRYRTGLRSGARNSATLMACLGYRVMELDTTTGTPDELARTILEGII